MNRKLISVDELLWIFHEAVRDEFGNHATFAMSVIPESRYGWAVVRPTGKKLREDVLAAFEHLEKKLRRKYRVDFGSFG